jgi:hypothetical protein
VPPLLVHCRTISGRYGRVTGDTLDCDYAIPASKPTRTKPFRFAAPGSIHFPLRHQLSPYLTLCGHRCETYYSRSQPLQYSIANIINNMLHECQLMSVRCLRQSMTSPINRASATRTELKMSIISDSLTISTLKLPAGTPST